ncbi:MAG: AbrB/MazE/SpoVT family DNA-binding domain-containing protein [Bacteroidota bacterium]
MTVARSKLTAQGQISVPAEVRRRLGLAPGAVLEWSDEDGRIVVRRAGRFTSEEISKALFATRRRAATLAELKEGLRAHVRKRHARG